MNKLNLTARFNLDRCEWIAYEHDPSGKRPPVNTSGGRTEKSALKNAAYFIKKHGSSFAAQ